MNFGHCVLKFNMNFLGTTVTSELVWLIVNNMNYNEAVRMHLTERVPFLE